MKITFSVLNIVLALTLYSSLVDAKVLVFSDIDDTVKQANTMGGTKGYIHFLKKKPFLEARDLFNEIKNNSLNAGEEIKFFYVSAAPSFTFKGTKWINKHNFPSGPMILKTKENGGPTYDYKYNNMKAIIEYEQKRGETISKVLFFGDNSQHDAQVYYDLTKNMGLDSEIYIRDVSTEATFFDSTLPVKRLPGVIYFFSEIELINEPTLYFMSDKLKALITKNYNNQTIIPNYTLKTLTKRVKKLCQAGYQVLTESVMRDCRETAKLEAKLYFRDYYSRY